MSDKLIEQLTNMPQEIKSKKETRFAIIQNKKEVLDFLVYQEANIKDEILKELDENGKKKYSNETARKAEFDQRSKFDERYSELNEKLNGIDKDLTFQNIEIEYLEDTQRNLRAILNYKANL